ncbi:MAG: transcriptional regulator GcvA [Deltaproteobacteria bacterium]|nr:transcriptional regulator GcvA [Deltaproteobacteria bacterium]
MAFELPPLNALRAFEIAATRLSFKDAARVLHVTPGAVSQQVRTLEEALGVRLFSRTVRRVSLTEAGQTLLPAAREAFQRLELAVGALRQQEESGPITVSVVPSFAAKWLVPRLGRLHAVHPEISVRISATLQLADFVTDGVDVAIRIGKGKFPGLQVLHLMNEDLFPVCSPRLLEGQHALRAPADLRHHTLLHDEHYDGWREWLNQNGGEDVIAEQGAVFNDASLALQAAIAGLGVAMTRTALAADDLAAGLLVRPFPGMLPSRFSIWIVCPKEYARRPKVARFMDWLLAEARRDSALTRD